MCLAEGTITPRSPSVVHVSLSVTGREVLGVGDDDTNLRLGIDVGSNSSKLSL